MANNLYDFQEAGINSISKKLFVNDSVLAVSPTGSGKAVMIATIASRFIQKSNKDVIIFIHRAELLQQTRQKLFDWYGIVSQSVDASTRSIQPVRVFVAMVETFNNRSKLETFLSHFKNIGLLIVDEAHLASFKKIFIHFYNAKRIGFTATPIAANKKDPLKNYYKDVTVISTVKELVELNELLPSQGVVPCIEYSLKNLDRSQLSIKGQDFDEDKMGIDLSRKPQLDNTINAYIKHGYNKKTIIFNANISHSISVTKAFKEHGFNVRHLDGTTSGEYGNSRYREQTFKWFNETPNAILCNVGIATIGTDIPSVETIIVNKATMSLPLFKQMIGRGGRPYKYPNGEYKREFLLLDMGDNIEGGNMGRYDDGIDWEFIFNNPNKPRHGISAVKTCPECGAINTASARICTAKVEDWLSEEEGECGYLFPIKDKEYDEVPKEMILIGGGIDVRKNIEFFKDRAEFYSMFETVKQIARKARKEIVGDYLDSTQLQYLSEITQTKISEWFKIKGKHKYRNFKEDCMFKIINELKTEGFIVSIEEIEELTGVVAKNETENENI